MATNLEESEMAKRHDRMEKYFSELSTTTINRKLEMASDMLKFLSSNGAAINRYDNISQFIEGLGAHWVNSLNPKVSQYGIEALLIIADAMEGKYKSYSGTVFTHVINKLGDSKEAVREQSKMYLLKTVEMGNHNPDWVLEKLITALSSKNKDMGLQAQSVILQMLIMEQNKRLSSEILDNLLVVELSLFNTMLREEAPAIILNLSERIGKTKVIEEINKATARVSAHVSKKMHNLIDKIRATHSEQPEGATPAGDIDEVDLTVRKMKELPLVTPKPKLKSSLAGTTVAGATAAQDIETVPKMKTLQPVTPKPKLKLNLPGAGTYKTGQKMSSSLRSKLTEGDKYVLYSGPAGEADEAWFLKAFEDVPPMAVLNQREFENIIKTMTADLKSGPDFWQKKVNALKKIRSLIINSSSGYEDEIFTFIRDVELDIVNTLKDLRSQVVRETCLTIAFMSRETKNKIDSHTYEVIILQLMTNVSCAAKVVATCSYIALKFLFSHVTHSRLIGTLTQALMNHKARETRVAVCELLEHVLLTWPVSRIEQNIPELQDLILQGAAENTTEARLASRRAYWAFHGNFPEQAELLINSMSVAVKKYILAGDKAAVGVGLNKTKKRALTTLTTTVPKPVPTTAPKPVPTTAPKPSPTTAPKRAPTTAPKSAPTTAPKPAATTAPKPVRHAGKSVGTQTDKFVCSNCSTSRRTGSAIPVPTRRFLTDPASVQRTPNVITSVRSKSAIDIQAVERAQARHQYAAIALPRVGSEGSLPSSSSSSPPSQLIQPTTTYYMPETNTLMGQSRRNNPRSQGASRETGPIKLTSKPARTNLFVTKRSRKGYARDCPPIQPSTSVMAQKMLALSLEEENSSQSGESYDGDGGDNKVYDESFQHHKRTYCCLEELGDDSNECSVCSKRSFDS